MFQRKKMERIPLKTIRSANNDTEKKASSSVPSSIGGESSAMGAKLEQQTPILYTPPRAIKDVPVSTW